MSARRVRTVVMSAVGALLIVGGALIMVVPQPYVSSLPTSGLVSTSTTGGWYDADLVDDVVMHERAPIVEAWRGADVAALKAQVALVAAAIVVLLGVVLILLRRRVSYLALAVGALVMSLLLANVGGASSQFIQLVALGSFVAVIALGIARVVSRRGGRRLGPSGAR